MKKFLDSNVGIGIGLVLFAFLAFGGWRLFVPGPPDPLHPRLTAEQRRRKSGLESALQEEGIKLVYFIPDGNDARVTLHWTYANATYGAQELEKHRLKGDYKAYQPEGAHFLDVQFGEGEKKTAYTGRYVIHY